MKRLLTLIAALGLVAGMAQAQGKLEIFSWWAGDEGPALEALIKLYNQQYPGVDVINATVTGGSGVNARAVLKTRMLGGDPPDSFQVHAGQELIGDWVAANRMEDLTSLFQQQGWLDAFPQNLIDLISTPDGIWSVPVNIHRANVLWYVPADLEKWGVTAPASWEEFLVQCPKLQAQGVTPLVVAENWTQVQLWETIAISTLGPQGWNDLWTGKVAFTDPKAVQAWDTFGKVMQCANSDASGLTWQQATDRVVSGQAAYNVMGDWAAGYMTTTLKLTPGTDFGWEATPGTQGVFDMLADSFGLPKGAQDRQNTLNWLELIGSKQGQDTFNPLKGSISPRLDSDLSLYNAYSQSAAKDWQADTIVGSLAHGAAAKTAFLNQFADVIGIYFSSGSSEQAANAAQAIALQTGLYQ
ncbi:MAG TPA: ABC transporter substrate-binding protein [Trueperaceae bacterium]|nr:ABC transporter substrate-binding protein [Trueperaceae bacterium]